jgi:hypothetical protein
MNKPSQALVRVVAALAFIGFISSAARAQNKPFEPEVGQAGKDVIWVPTPPELVEKMLDLANVTSQDLVMDLGSGDGRNVIAAAKRGARGVGVEYNPQMVEYSARKAAEAGVTDKARFVQGDMYAADISQATVLALFLLPSNMLQLRSKFLDLRPGSRIVSNTFGIQDWTPDRTETVPSPCEAWCTAHLWIVPAKVGGTWKLPNGQLTLTQTFQMVTGTLATANGSTPVAGKLTGEQITLQAGNAEYVGRVTGDVMEGTMTAGATKSAWKATRN